MDYVLLIYEAEERLQKPIEEQRPILEAYLKFTVELARSGRLGDASQLEATTTATTVRVRDNKRLVTDGPFAETREQLGGYYVVRAESEQEALAIAEGIPSVRFGAIEVRQVASANSPAANMTAAPNPDHKKEYLFLIYGNEVAYAALDEKERAALHAGYRAFTESIAASFIAGAPLYEARTARSVRGSSGTPLVTDGPFAETREQLGGYYRVFANNLDEALDMAARVPSAAIGSIEVRPVKPFHM